MGTRCGREGQSGSFNSRLRLILEKGSWPLEAQCLGCESEDEQAGISSDQVPPAG